MIEIMLKEIASRLGKSITDIAHETGLNRNTVTDLFHNKVDGIKFSTIDTLCETYGLTLQDLVSRKEFRIGAAPTSKIVREIRTITPFFSWLILNALHKPSPQFFDMGIGNIYAFFIRDGAELYFDQREANRCARAIYERYRKDALEEVYSAFTQSRDQILANIRGLATQPLKQFVSSDLIKAFQRLSDVSADLLSVSAWLEVFDFGIRDEIVHQMQKAHQFSQAEITLLLASGETASSITRRLAVLQLSQIALETNVFKASDDALKLFISTHRDAKSILITYPYISEDALLGDLKMYVTNPDIVTAEKEELDHLSRHHKKAVRDALQAHGLRLNPLAFFAKLTHWRDERDETLLRIDFQMQSILNIVSKRSNISPTLAPYLLPQELEPVQTGLVTERTLRHRSENGLLIALEHGNYRVYEGEQAVSVQDDLASRCLSQLAYENLS